MMSFSMYRGYLQFRGGLAFSGIYSSRIVSHSSHKNTDLECSMLRISGKEMYRIKLTLSGKGLANFISSRQFSFLLILTCHNGGIAGGV